MRFRLVPVALLLAAAAALAGAQAPHRLAPKTPALTVHEWGTFTSIAGEDGQAVSGCPWAAGAISRAS